MASRPVQIVQVVDATEVDAILAEAGDSQRPNLLETWLDKNPAAKEMFWTVMEEGYRDGDLKCARILKSFLKRYPECPQIGPQTGKRIVDAKFAANS